MKCRRWLLILTLCVLVLLIGVLWAPWAGEHRLKPIGKTEFVTSRDGTRIAFTKLGSGPPLVMVDGAFCYRGNGPAPELAPVLAKDFTVYAYDRRGAGKVEIVVDTRSSAKSRTCRQSPSWPATLLL
jgi:hypothetical protein